MILPFEYSLELSPLFVHTPVYDWADGWLSPLQRALLQQSQKEKKELHFNIGSLLIDEKNLQDEILSYFSFKNFFQNVFPYAVEDFAPDCHFYFENEKKKTSATSLLQSFGRQLENDLSLLDNHNILQKEGFIQTQKNVFIHPQAQVSSLSSLETQDGIIVIDAGANVSAFSIVRAPAYIGRNAHIDKAFLSNVRIGDFCRIGGEVSNSLIAPFSNKHHEGFVGHSLLGSWVNLGALTTTSDLKNNYGKIKLQYQENVIETGEIKFGSIVGDFVKTAIGTMLNTGTIVDVAALLFAGFKTQKYYAPFFWGGSHPSLYEWERFVKDAEKIMARRNQSLLEYQKKRLKVLHQEAKFLRSL